MRGLIHRVHNLSAHAHYDEFHSVLRALARNVEGEAFEEVIGLILDLLKLFGNGVAFVF